MMTLGGDKKPKPPKGSKAERVERGYMWITMLVHRCIRNIEDKKHRAWRKKYYGDQAKERRAKRLSRASKGPIIGR